MAPRPSTPLLPFLYPHLWRAPRPARILSRSLGHGRHSHISPPPDEVLDLDPSLPRPNPHNPAVPTSHLNPLPDDYKITSFADRCSLTIHAGHGGNGCISFVRDLHFNGQAHGPPNGGDGGHGGNVYIAAAYGETSLHKLGRKRVVRAGRGKSGQGSSKDGQRGDDVVITVPVGTVVRETYRSDPINEEKSQARARRRRRKEEMKARAEHEEARALEALKAGHMGDEAAEKAEEEAQKEKDWDEYEYPHRDKWVFYPGISSTERRNLRLPRLPKRERLFAQPAGPLVLDLSRPTPRPILIAAGGLGGLGNPHFAQQRTDRPLIATKGEPAVSLKLDLELKLLADVGFVGLPNAGKSTLLRALTNSRARIGNWAFTTLKPNIGTVVLDSYRGRVSAFPKPKPKPVQDDSWEIIDDSQVEPRTRFTIADIPGLIEGAHLDRGLGMEFLRHVERAGVLAFVIDLSAGPAVDALKSLWSEVGLYAQMREDETYSRERERYIDWDFDAELTPQRHKLLDGSTWKPGAETLSAYPLEDRLEDGASASLHIASKPWFVIATKCDLPKTQKNYQELKTYLDRVTEGEEPHPSGVEYGWTESCAAIPVSAINGHGTEAIVHWTVGLLDL